MKRFALVLALGLLLGTAAHATDPDTMMLADPNSALNVLLHKRYDKMVTDAQAKNAQSKAKDKAQSTPDDASTQVSKPGDAPAAADARTPNPKAIDPKTVLVKPKIAKPNEASAEKVNLKHGKPSPELNHPEHHLTPPPEFQRISPQLEARRPISTGAFTIPQPAEPAQ